jgi:hypothetical protein
MSLEQPHHSSQSYLSLITHHCRISHSSLITAISLVCCTHHCHISGVLNSSLPYLWCAELITAISLVCCTHHCHISGALNSSLPYLWCAALITVISLVRCTHHCHISGVLHSSLPYLWCAALITALSLLCCRNSIKKILASPTSTVEKVHRSAKQRALREKNERSRGNILLAKEESARLCAEKGSFLRTSLHASTSRANMMLEAEVEARKAQRDKRGSSLPGSSTLVSGPLKMLEEYVLNPCIL